MQAPKEIKNEQMTLAHKKYFVNFIKSGGNFKSFRAEYLRIFKKETSRSTFARLKRDSEKILAADTHRNKRATYKTENAEEKKMFEQHCVKVILDCHKRRFAIKLSIPLVTQILMNESVKFDYDWLRNMQFSHCYVSRFLKEHELVWTGKKSDQTYISDDQMSIYRFVIWIIRN